MKDLQKSRKQQSRKQQIRKKQQLQYEVENNSSSDEEHSNTFKKNKNYNKIKFDNIQSNIIQSLNNREDYNTEYNVNDLSPFVKNINLDRNLFNSDSRESIRFSQSDNYNDKVSNRFFQTYKNEPSIIDPNSSLFNNNTQFNNNQSKKKMFENESNRWQTPSISNPRINERLPSINTSRFEQKPNNQQRKPMEESHSVHEKFNPANF